LYILDRLKEKLNIDFKNLDELFENSNNIEHYKVLYEILNGIKILDPSCGSGHFLERSIEILVDIYDKLRKKLKELEYNDESFTIKITDEFGKIKTENLLSIVDDEEFKMRIKFHIIVSKNIYGVDINRSAVKISKARLFISIAKHFDKEKGIFVRFPNVHFNIKTGNSLIGYARIKKPEKTVLDTWMNLENDKIEELKEEFKVVSELEDYLKEVSKILNQDGNIIKDIEKLNKIISKKEINWLDFEDVLKIKEKLIEIIIVSLNSKYAIPLNDLLRDINNKFNEKLDEKFKTDFGLDIDKDCLKNEVKTFHWFFEFSEVFINNNGFDVILGNPPYGNILNNTEKKIVKILYKTAITDKKGKGSTNISSIFVEGSYYLLRDNGVFGMIVPHRITRAEEFSKLIDFLLSKTNLYHIVDSGNPFKPYVNLEMVELFYKKSKKQGLCITKSRRFKDFVGYLDKDLCKKFKILMIYFNDDLKKLFYAMCKDALFNVIDATQGKPRRKDYVKDGDIICIGARDIDPYVIKLVSDRRVNKEYIIKNKLEWQLESELLVCPNFSNRFEVGIKKKGFLPDGTSVIIKPKVDIDNYYLMAVLNSDLINFYLWNFILNRGELTNNICSFITNRIPIKIKDEEKIIKMAKDVEIRKIDKYVVDEEIEKIYLGGEKNEFI
jgi:hypothetical protein